MDYNRIIQLIQNPESLTVSDKYCIEQELEKYPFTPSFYVLQLKWNRLFSSEEVGKTVEKLSTYSTYRELIKEICDQPVKREIPVFLPVKPEVTIQEKEVEQEPVLEDKIVDKKEEKEEELIMKEEEIEVKEEKNEEVSILQTEEEISAPDPADPIISIAPEENFEKEEEPKQSYIGQLGLSHLFSGKGEVQEPVEKELSEETEVYKPVEVEQKIQESTKEEEDLKAVESESFSPDENAEKPEIEEINNIQNEPEEANTDLVSDIEIAAPVEEENQNIEKKTEVQEKETLPEKQEKITEVEENEGIVTPDEKLTFSQWISLSGQKRSVNEEKKPAQKRQKEIIEKFIENNPKINTPKKEGKVKPEIDPKKEEIKDIANLMTITLAKLYIEQGKYDTAITAFKILSLKYPEKSSYFLSEIKRIKKLKNSK